MGQSAVQERFSADLFAILEETLDTHHGIYLDKGTSLFATLDEIDAGQASKPVGGRCATIAAQVEHVIFYLEVLQRYVARQDVGDIDWNEVWSRVGGVTDEEWAELRARLRATCDAVTTMLHGIEDWGQPQVMGGAMAIVVHTAYHLGEIRQALCTVTPTAL